MCSMNEGDMERLQTVYAGSIRRGKSSTMTITVKFWELYEDEEREKR
jgi:hypothetical protein